MFETCFRQKCWKQHERMGCPVTSCLCPNLDFPIGIAIEISNFTLAPLLRFLCLIRLFLQHVCFHVQYIQHIQQIPNISNNYPIYPIYIYIYLILILFGIFRLGNSGLGGWGKRLAGVWGTGVVEVICLRN